MHKVKVRILRPNPVTAVTLGYVKGKILEVSPEQAATWAATRYAEYVEEPKQSRSKKVACR